MRNAQWIRVAASMAVALALVGVDASRGANIITPTDVFSTSLDAPAQVPDNLINGSGLSGIGPVETQTHDNNFQALTMWHVGPDDGGLGGPTGSPPVVDDQALIFDLGGTFSLLGTYIWNHNQSALTSRGVDEFEILVSGDSNPLTATFGSVGTFNLLEAGGGAELAQLINFNASGVRLVKFNINSTQSGLVNDYVGLSEVRFVIPEPSSLVLACLGTIGLCVFRRRRHEQ